MLVLARLMNDAFFLLALVFYQDKQIWHNVPQKRNLPLKSKPVYFIRSKQK